MKLKIAIAALLLMGFAHGAAKDYVLTTKRIGDYTVAIGCKNGADPTGNKYGEILLISCKDMRK
jgi:hypothetical protein